MVNIYTQGFPGASEDKASACNAGDPGSIPGLGRSPGEGNGNPLQYSCLENPMDRGAWRATSPRGCKELDMTERLHSFTHSYTHTHAQIPTCDNFIEKVLYYLNKFQVNHIYIIYIHINYICLEFISILLYFFNKIFTCGYIDACVCVGVLKNFY